MKPASVLISWYNKNKRDLPWRHSNDPYIIWLSEIILQQTQVSQGLPYFYRFLEAFPDLKAFAGASEEKVLKLWQGLGYYSRARNMLLTAKQIQKKYKGKFPPDYDELKKLKGVGDYTAAAIASFAFNKPHAVLDGNVYRFLSRYYGIDTPINTGKGKKQFLAIANQILDKKQPAVFNQAIMEFGAIQCKPKNPGCEACVLIDSCFASKHKMVASFPVKNKTQKTRDRYFNYLFIKHKDYFFIKKRAKKDIWQHLFELPLIESKKPISPSLLVKNKQFLAFANNNYQLLNPVVQIRHKLTHQTIHATFYPIKLKGPLTKDLKEDFIKIKHDNLSGYPFSRLIEKYLSEHFN